MSRYSSVLIAGFVFGLGLAVSGMTHASKVLGFLDVAGKWDPSLLFVLGGAVGVTAIVFRFILRRSAPVLEDQFYLPIGKGIDRPLVAGAVIFGVGWGISGYCPGPGIALLAAPDWEALVFVPALLVGALLHRISRAPASDATRAPTLEA